MTKHFRTQLVDATRILTVIWLKPAYAVCLFLGISPVFAVKLEPVTHNFGFTQDLQALKPSLNFTTQDEKTYLVPSANLVKTRTLKLKPYTEPVSMPVPVAQKALAEWSAGLAKNHKASALMDYLQIKLSAAKTPPSVSGNVTIELDAEGLKLINMDALRLRLARDHHKVSIRSTLPRAMAKDLLRQVRPYLSTEKFTTLKNKLQDRQSISLDRDLLPSYPAKMVGKFVSSRGPNCFHAALAFQGRAFTLPGNYNVKTEAGYHDAMINYDELYRALKLEFYEIDPSKTAMQYGDMIVFFDVPANDPQAVSFRWIRHATTYLFGPYTFSKGSKSPDTPYAVRLMAEEWNEWRSYTKNLGVKVYRRNTPTQKPGGKLVLNDWAY